MSPEQGEGAGGAVDHRADLWALGCMAYECLIGRPVWNTDQGVAMTFAAIAAASVPVPSKQRADLPQAFDQWFGKCLERDPNNRYQTAKDLAEALARAFGGDQHISAVNLSGENNPRAATATAEQLQSEMFLDDEQAMGTKVRSGDRMASSGGGLAAAHEQAERVGTGPLAERKPPPAAEHFADAPPISSTPASDAHLTNLAPAAPTGPPPPKVPLEYGQLHRVDAGALNRSHSVVSGLDAVPEAAGLHAARGLERRPPRHPDIDLHDGRNLRAGRRAPVGGRDRGRAAPLYRRERRRRAEEILRGDRSRGWRRRAIVPRRAPRSAVRTLQAHRLLRTPRIGIARSISRPAIANGGKGAVVVWTDDHEQAGHDHAYSVVIERHRSAPLRAHAISPPEGNEIMRPSLPRGGRAHAPSTTGTRAAAEARDPRPLAPGADGRIAGASVLVGAGKPGDYWPSIDRAPDGYYVAWADDRDRDGKTISGSAT